MSDASVAFAAGSPSDRDSASESCYMILSANLGRVHDAIALQRLCGCAAVGYCADGGGAVLRAVRGPL